jgi:hypothetical protein
VFKVSRRIADTKAAKEVAALDAFFETLADRPDRALYGPAHVLAAHDMLAIDKLLITDGLFRTSDTRQRRRWVYFFIAILEIRMTFFFLTGGRLWWTRCGTGVARRTSSPRRTPVGSS